MSDPTHEMSAPEAKLAQPEQALLLTRVVASVVAIACFAMGEMALVELARFKGMFADIAKDAELPVVTTMMVSARPILLAGVPLLFGVTLFFIWSRGKVAAWMAGAGLLLMILCASLASSAVLSPLMRIMQEMGNV